MNAFACLALPRWPQSRRGGHFLPGTLHFELTGLRCDCRVARDFNRGTVPKKPLFGLYLERRSGARLWLFAREKVHGFKHPPAVSPAHAFDAHPPGIEGHGQETTPRPSA